MEGCRTQEELPEQNQNPGPRLHTQNSSVPTALPALQHVRTSHQEGRCHLIKVFQANIFTKCGCVLPHLSEGLFVYTGDI